MLPQQVSQLAEVLMKYEGTKKYLQNELGTKFLFLLTTYS